MRLISSFARSTTSPSASWVHQELRRSFVIISSIAIQIGLLPSLISMRVFGGEEKVDFSREIRPILSEYCFKCHGFDPSSRQADLRLDQRESVLALQQGVAAIVPGSAETSEVWKRITSSDPEQQMPPPGTGKPLSESQQVLIRRWIEQGAQYAPHWAFSRIDRPAIPTFRNDSVAENPIVNPIDAFIERGLQLHQMVASPEADRHTLIRRLSQDLLGIQPTPEEADTFASDASPDAYERLVERLLQSPHYGERWGRHWLDQARYADSNGYTIDGPRIMWPYRDWVIDAVNRDLPFDQFTIEQLAGDLLPSATKLQRIATGFHRNTLINQEGGVKPDQFRHEAIIDRVNTTGAVWLGLTLGCAQCHTHKYDPISHQEYYQFYAFFNQCDDANNEATTLPVLENEIFGWNSSQLNDLKQLDSLRSQLTQLDQQLATSRSMNLISHAWNWQPAELVDYRTLGMGSFLKQADGSLLSDKMALPNDTYLVTLRTPAEKVTAIRLRVLTDDSLPMKGPGLADGNFVLTDARIKIRDDVIRFITASADHSQPGYDVLAAIDDDPQSGWAINVSQEQKQATPSLSMNAPHEAVFVLPHSLGRVEVPLYLRHDRNKNYLIGRFALDVSDVDPPINHSVAIETQLGEVKTQIANIENRLPGRGRFAQQMVMNDRDTFQETYRLDRGDFLSPDKAAGPLAPAVPAALIVGSASSMKNRLDLARWLVSRDNPLTARVIVNRVWMRYFGRGLVETENDFGAQGASPTHPELLDWLAVQWMESGWSMKQLHRLIVTSRTYRQSSAEHPQAFAIDPRNLWLGRQTRVRVDAEIIRDLVLSTSGVMADRIGGPSVHPPQPDGVYAFTQNKKDWPETTGPDRYRRTLYTMFYRSAPYPLLTTFDSPEFSTVCTRRDRSNTPLQALAVANDPMFIELAQKFALKTLLETDHSGETTTVIIRMFRQCLIRAPSEDEIRVMTEFWNRQVGLYTSDEAAALLLAPKDRGNIPLAESAAWVCLARLLMNTDEFLTRN